MFSCFTKTSAQKSISQKEVFTKWVSEEGVLNLNMKDGFDKFLHFDTVLANKLLNTIQKIQNDSIDTLGFYAVSYPGALIRDSCDYGTHYPISIYVFWKYQNNYYSKQIKTSCNFPFCANDSLALIFNYYIRNSPQIDSEYIMPSISKAKVDTSGYLTYESYRDFHTANYTIFCKIRNKIKFLNFSSDFLSNKKSIFLKYNLNTKSYKWFKKIQSYLE